MSVFFLNMIVVDHVDCFYKEKFEDIASWEFNSNF